MTKTQQFFANLKAMWGHYTTWFVTLMNGAFVWFLAQPFDAQMNYLAAASRILAGNWVLLAVVFAGLMVAYTIIKALPQTPAEPPAEVKP